MKIKDANIVVTGAGSGIGRALAHAFVRHGAASVVVADRDEVAAMAVADEINGRACQVDVASPAAMDWLIEMAEQDGPVDLFCSNAGITVRGGTGVSEPEWERIWRVNVMAHVACAKRLLPGMLERGSGHFLNVASAAGLLSQFDAPYTVTKHAAVAFAEWLSITYGDQGIGVSCLCPGGVDTPLFRSESEARQHAMGEGLLSPDQVAEIAIEGLLENRFLILTHEAVREQAMRRARDTDRWVHGMRKFFSSVRDKEQRH